MGYLDNSTIVVDAVLTKQGRKLLALGQGLNISYFTLTDTGVDYSLWNPDHPSGSAYYGEAIENLPNLEALPNSAYFMRNNLLTLNRDVKAMPYVTLNGFGIGQAASFQWENGSTATLGVNLKLENVASEDVGWQIVVPDSSLIVVSGTTLYLPNSLFQRMELIWVQFAMNVVSLTATKLLYSAVPLTVSSSCPVTVRGLN